MRFTLPLSIILSFFLVFFQNCARPFDVEGNPTSPITSTDPEFIPYIQDFEYYYGQDVSIPIGFGDEKEGIAGTCHYRWDHGRIVGDFIMVDRGYWPKMTFIQQKNLIFHELGHCVLGRDHVPWNNGVMACPSSFMYEAVMSDYCLQTNWDLYIKEMFGENR